MTIRYAPRLASFAAPGQTLRPVVGLDIDGTLGVYHHHFHNFAEGYVGKTLGKTFDYEGEEPFYKWLGISKETYRKVKLAYRRGGHKRPMPVYDGAADLAAGLRRAGAEVVICTTRPFLSLEAVDEDTRHWLGRNRIQYDGLSLGEWKYRDLARGFGDRVVTVLDDLPEMVDQAAAHGIRPILRRNIHNVSAARHIECSVAYGLNDAYDIILEMIGAWENSRITSSTSTALSGAGR